MHFHKIIDKTEEKMMVKTRNAEIDIAKFLFSWEIAIYHFYGDALPGGYMGSNSSCCVPGYICLEPLNELR